MPAVAGRQEHLGERRPGEALLRETLQLVGRTEEAGTVATGDPPPREACAEDDGGELRLELEADLTAHVSRTASEPRTHATEAGDLQRAAPPEQGIRIHLGQGHRSRRGSHPPRIVGGAHRHVPVPSGSRAPGEEVSAIHAHLGRQQAKREDIACEHLGPHCAGLHAKACTGGRVGGQGPVAVATDERSMSQGLQRERAGPEGPGVGLPSEAQPAQELAEIAQLVPVLRPQSRGRTPHERPHRQPQRRAELQEEALPMRRGRAPA